MAERILITGGAGFIGTNLIAHLAAHGYRLTVLDRAPRPALPQGVAYVRGDVRDPRAVARALAGADACVHLAAATRVIDSIADPATSFDVNVQGSLTLLDAARTAGVHRFVAASTGGAILGDAPVPVNEAMAPAPISPYGASKLAMEGYLSAYAGSYGLRAAALRFSNVYGPGSRHKGSVVAVVCNALLAGEPFTIHGDGSQVRDYLYVGDLVAGIRQALAAGVMGVYQLGSGTPTTLNALLAGIRDAAGMASIPVRHAPFRTGEIHTTYCDIAKAHAAFGFTPETPLTGGLARTWTWFRTSAAREAGAGVPAAG